MDSYCSKSISSKWNVHKYNIGKVKIDFIIHSVPVLFSVSIFLSQFSPEDSTFPK